MFDFKDKKIPFDQLVWLGDREKRIQMIPSMLKSKVLLGLNKVEVLNLLGFEFNDINSKTWSYYIGKNKFIFPFKYFLYIYFDGFGRVYRIHKRK